MSISTGNSISEAIKRAHNLCKTGKAKQALTLLLKTVSHPHFKNQPIELQQQAAIVTGSAYYNQGNLNSAESCYLQAVHLARQTDNAPSLYNSLDNLAAVYINTERKQQAIECLQQATTVKEKSGNLQDIGKGLLQLAGVYFSIENFEAGKRELKKAEDCIRKYKQQQFYPHLYFAKGMQLKREEKITEALQAYNTSIRYALLTKEWLMAVRAYTNKAGILISQQQWSRAEKDSLAALKLVKQHSIKVDALFIYTQLANISIERKNFLKAKHYISLIKKEAERYGNQMVLRDTEELTARLFEATNHPELALAHYKKYIEHYRQFYSTELNRSVLDIQAKYETEKRERELQQIKLLNTQNELKALRLQINPHFISNALVSVQLHQHNGSAQSSNQKIVRLSRLVRLMLDAARQPVMPLSTNLELLHMYIETEREQKAVPFAYSIKVSPQIKPASLYVHGLLLQPLVENAIHHGLYHKPGANARLTISFAKTKNALSVTITDNGIGRKAAARHRKEGHRSHATAIIKETLALLWPRKESEEYFSVTDIKDKSNRPAGTRVKLLLPLMYSPPAPE